MIKCKNLDRRRINIYKIERINAFFAYDALYFFKKIIYSLGNCDITKRAESAGNPLLNKKFIIITEKIIDINDWK